MGGAFNDSMGKLWGMGISKREKGMEEAISESESLIRWQRAGNNLPGNSEISGSADGRITKNAYLRKWRKSEMDLGFVRSRGIQSISQNKRKGKPNGRKCNIKKEATKFGK